jgi:hypothetical protein
MTTLGDRAQDTLPRICCGASPSISLLCYSVTSFPAAARRVRGADLPVGRRMLMLRECAVHFAPYGFRATWHHLLVSAAIPRRLEDDPAALVRAVEELEEARAVWMSHMAAFAARRAREKAAGERSLRKADRWHHRGIHHLAYCPDPELHPRDRLATVVQTLIAAYSSQSDWSGTCPVCGYRRWQQPCPQCGIELRAHLSLPPQQSRMRAPGRWGEIWRRTPKDAKTFPTNKLGALRLGRRLVAEVPASQPGRRAFVNIIPVVTEADKQAARQGWNRRDTARSFRIRHREYDEAMLDTDDYDIGAVLVRTASADGEAALIGVLADWGLHPEQFEYPWDTDDPQ